MTQIYNAKYSHLQGRSMSEMPSSSGEIYFCLECHGRSTVYIDGVGRGKHDFYGDGRKGSNIWSFCDAHRPDVQHIKVRDDNNI